MARKKADGSAQRLLEAWVPPADAGEPLGCVATTFTFDPVFFEEHCLSRFLRLETDPREDGAAYLIEREEKLAQSSVSVIVDRSMADGSASPRWGVLSVALPVGIQHAKVSVLGWHGLIRVLVGSANLTEAGYRKNQEVFGVLDFRDGGEVPFEVLDEILSFVQGLARFAPGSSTEPGPKARLEALVAGLRATARRWTLEPRRGEWPQAVPVLLGPMEQVSEPIPERLGRLMRDGGGPAHSACVLSPFFDKSSETAYAPTRALVAALTERGERAIEFLVPTESLPDGRLRFRAPRSLAEPGHRTATVSVYPVHDEADGEVRLLHAKSLWLWNERWHAYMIGSSNFTTAGLGLQDRNSPSVSCARGRGPSTRAGRRTCTSRCTAPRREAGGPSPRRRSLRAPTPRSSRFPVARAIRKHVPDPSARVRHVAAVPWDHVHVDVEDRLTRYGAVVQAEVVALGVVRLVERTLHGNKQIPEACTLGAVELEEIGDMPARNDERVPRRERERVGKGYGGSVLSRDLLALQTLAEHAGLHPSSHPARSLSVPDSAVTTGNGSSGSSSRCRCRASRSLVRPRPSSSTRSRGTRRYALTRYVGISAAARAPSTTGSS